MNIFGLGSGKTKTFRKNKKGKDDSITAPQLSDFSLSNLISSAGNMRRYVTLPDGEDRNEWLATHTLDFFNLTNIFYGTITEYCTNAACPVMSAGPLYEYWWRVDPKKKAVKVSAPEYVDYLMTWIQEQLTEENMFPTMSGTPFPKNFASNVKKIFARLFRVYGHIYHSHLPHVVAMGQEVHLNTIFLHLLYFIQEFDLVEKKELEPLTDVICRLDAAAAAELLRESSAGSLPVPPGERSGTGEASTDLSESRIVAKAPTAPGGAAGSS